MVAAPSLLRRGRYRAILEQDLRRLRRRTKDIFDFDRPRTGTTALVVSLSSFPYQLKLEGMLATALQLHGCRAVVAVYAGSDLPRRYLECFGLDEFVELADYAPEGLDAPPFEPGLVVDGVPVGQYVLSTASRILHQASVDVAANRALLDELAATTVRSIRAGGRLLDELEPGLVLFNERNYAQEAPLCDAALARGINVVQWVNAFQDDGLVFKRYTSETKGLHPRSLSDASWERIRALEWTAEREAALAEEFRLRYEGGWGLARRNHGWTRPYPRERLVEELRLDPARKTAVLFSHILWDANMFWRGLDLFADQQAWFVETVRAACANDRVNWIVKLHPANIWKQRRDGFEGEGRELEVLRERVGELPPHVHVLRAGSDVSTRSIFELADYGITIRGSIGIELPCFGVPVLTAGSGFYSGRGFTVDFASADQYLACLARIEELPPLTDEQTLLAKKHAYALFCLRPARFTSFSSVFRPLEELGHPLDHDLLVNVRTREELEGAPDLRRFAEWAVDSRDLDYLAQPDR